MWTSSYLPRRTVLVLSAALVALLIGLCGLYLHARRCPRRAERPPAVGAIPVRLHLGGTPGACVRLDGHVVGPIPAEVELRLRAPRRVFVHACKRGHLEYAGELELHPGAEVVEHIWLSRDRPLRPGHGPHGSGPYGRFGAAPLGHRPVPCPCDEDRGDPPVSFHPCRR